MVNRTDLRRSLRGLSGPLIAGCMVLGLGIGTATGVFNVLYSLLWRPLPVESPGDLVAVYRTNETGVDYGPTSYPVFASLREGSRTLSDLAASSEGRFVLRHSRGTDVVWCGEVSAHYFRLLGVKSHRGRVFGPTDAEAAAPPVLVLSHRYWQDRLGGDPTVVGETVTLDGEATTVAGIAAPAFSGTIFEYSLDCWRPIRDDDPRRHGADRRWLTTLVGRRGEGRSLEMVEQELGRIGAGLAGPSDEAGVLFHVVPLRLNAVPLVRQHYVRLYGLLGLAAAFVLLAAGNNLASLLLARALTRRPEHAVTLALGARRRTLLRPYLLDGMILASVAGAVGLPVALGISRALEGMFPAWEATLALDLTFDTPTWLVLAGLILATAAILTVTPWIVGLRTRPARDLQGRNTPSRRTTALRHALVTAQIPLSLVLLVAAALILSSLAAAYAIDIGFDSHDVAVVALPAPDDDDLAARKAGLRQLAEDVGQLPGVRTVALAQGFPFGFNWSGASVPRPDGSAPITVGVNAVAPEFFEALDLPLLAGRAFDATLDRAGQRPVAVVSGALAEALWPEGDAVGRSLPPLEEGAERWTVVGVVGDVRARRLLEGPWPFIYRPLSQADIRSVHLLVEGRRGAFLPQLPAQVRESAPALPLDSIRTLDSYVYFFYWQQRLLSLFVGLLGLVAVTLAALGLYGTMRYLTRRRGPEVALRMALGADRRSVVRLIVRQAMGWSALGILLGVVGAALVGRYLLTSFLVETEPWEPWVFLSATLALLSISGFATWLPARRASGIEPAEGLRRE